MKYKHLESGLWKDAQCGEELPFICQMHKDPDLPEPSYNRGIECIYPKGWLRLDNLCFKMFAGNPMTWEEAESACQREGAHLVSISSTSVLATVTFLSTEVNKTFWIGLKYRESKKQIAWLNGWPATISRWSKNEPAFLQDDSCLASTAEGYWNKAPCTTKMPYVCQITTGKAPPLKLYRGDCPKTVDPWLPSDGSYCYICNKKYRKDWYSSMADCFGYGSSLVSLHSLTDLEQVKQIVNSKIPSVYLGLTRNPDLGFVWTDGSPVDFVNWDRGQPENEEDSCVEMRMDTLKWGLIPCLAKRHFVCARKKDLEVDDFPENAQPANDSTSGISVAALAGILVASVLVIIVIVAAVFYYRPLGKSRFRILRRTQSVSYENALYNADTTSLEFHTDKEIR